MILRGFFAVLLTTALSASAHARSVTVENNCEEGVRCLRVYDGIEKIEFCLDPGQSHEVDGLDEGATYCAWCSDGRLPEDCRQFPVEFD
ncbi:hypothetical protein [Dichotomicrobium thermohalophilum]|uniref:Uncharacterized protein n=1 Tax=Dichotomicrobium thermohalophilum TaxID=933063 RepID=A0A397PJS6_9HYPH|nr:hypothetical protein [Dichotomicrobium thermohalophilum]RIA47515.1 hypothetical protein BXY53_2069 [Dichotomicrobium thermohalophilum]